MSDDATQTISSDMAAPSPGRRVRGVMARIALGFGITIAVLVALGLILYFLGGMWTRTPEMRAAHEELVSAGLAEPVDARLVVPIPGCVCHSDDPVAQAEHSVRRISECGECH